MQQVPIIRANLQNLMEVVSDKFPPTLSLPDSKHVYPIVTMGLSPVIWSTSERADAGGSLSIESPR